MKKSTMAMVVAGMMMGGYGIYKYYKSHTNEINGCVKDTMNKMKKSMEDISENMM